MLQESTEKKSQIKTSPEESSGQCIELEFNAIDRLLHSSISGYIKTCSSSTPTTRTISHPHCLYTQCASLALQPDLSRSRRACHCRIARWFALCLSLYIELDHIGIKQMVFLPDDGVVKNGSGTNDDISHS